jgi:protein TonB
VAETKIATASPVEEPPPTPKPVTAKPKPVPAPPSEQRAASVADTAARGPVPGKAGAGGASSEERGAASTSGYQAKLAAHLRRFRSFPEEARKRGISGIATVRFTVNAAGAVTSASLAKSSGAGVLDAAAVAMVHRASPFPPIPPNLGVGVMTVNVPVRFDLR